MVLPSTLKLLQKSDRSAENGITSPEPVRNTSAFPGTINITVLLLSSITLIFFWKHKNYGKRFQQLLGHSTTRMTDTLCPISTINHQLTQLEQTHICYSLPCERWTVKWRDCASALHSFREITYRMDEWTKQLLRLKSWAISGNPEQWMEIRRLWWTVFVFKQAICFTCLIYIVCWSNTCFFWNFPLLFSSFNEFDLEVKVHRQFLGKVTLP